MTDRMLRLLVLVLGGILSLVDGVALGQSDPSLPFPKNRVIDFYSRQAAGFLAGDQKLPEDVLPQFPGLDGGGFGHWGQNPEDVSFDRSLNEAETGNVVMQLTHHFGRTTSKAVNVLLDPARKFTILYDPLKFTATDAWQGQFVNWGFVRFGLMDGVRAGGDSFWPMTSAGWRFAGDTQPIYRGFHRAGVDVVFETAMGSAVVFDHSTVSGTRWVRHAAGCGADGRGNFSKSCGRTRGCVGGGWPGCRRRGVAGDSCGPSAANRSALPCVCGGGDSGDSRSVGRCGVWWSGERDGAIAAGCGCGVCGRGGDDGC
ncbi:MAG UNVERIFIED_CONTAM: hypothetical protein LVR18_20505 [Planctomycetaceae bacterium]